MRCGQLSSVSPTCVRGPAIIVHVAAISVKSLPDWVSVHPFRTVATLCIVIYFLVYYLLWVPCQSSIFIRAFLDVKYAWPRYARWLADHDDDAMHHDAARISGTKVRGGQAGSMGPRCSGWERPCFREPADWQRAAFLRRFDHLPPRLRRFPPFGHHLNRGMSKNLHDTFFLIGWPNNKSSTLYLSLSIMRTPPSTSDTKALSL